MLEEPDPVDANAVRELDLFDLAAEHFRMRRMSRGVVVDQMASFIASPSPRCGPTLPRQSPCSSPDTMICRRHSAYRASLVANADAGLTSVIRRRNAHAKVRMDAVGRAAGSCGTADREVFGRHGRANQKTKIRFDICRNYVTVVSLELPCKVQHAGITAREAGSTNHHSCWRGQVETRAPYQCDDAGHDRAWAPGHVRPARVLQVGAKGNQAMPLLPI